jgi:hypothetical protein
MERPDVFCAFDGRGKEGLKVHCIVASDDTNKKFMSLRMVNGVLKRHIGNFGTESGIMFKIAYEDIDYVIKGLEVVLESLKKYKGEPYVTLKDQLRENS